MANYGQCKYCKHCDVEETNGCKVYCEWNKIYEDPDEIKDCPHFDTN